MGFDGLAECSSVVVSVKEAISSYDKKCNTVYALADQIIGMERCEKDTFDIPNDTFPSLNDTITSKIVEELHNLSLIVSNMDAEQESMSTVVGRIESICQSLLERGNHNAAEFQHLRMIYAASNYLATLIEMKKFHLDTMNFSDIKSFSRARKDESCKPIERELDKYVIVSKKK